MSLFMFDKGISENEISTVSERKVKSFVTTLDLLIDHHY